MVNSGRKGLPELAGHCDGLESLRLSEYDGVWCETGWVEHSTPRQSLGPVSRTEPMQCEPVRQPSVCSSSQDFPQQFRTVDDWVISPADHVHYGQ